MARCSSSFCRPDASTKSLSLEKRSNDDGRHLVEAMSPLRQSAPAARADAARVGDRVIGASDVGVVAGANRFRTRASVARPRPAAPLIPRVSAAGPADTRYVRHALGIGIEPAIGAAVVVVGAPRPVRARFDT